MRASAARRGAAALELALSSYDYHLPAARIAQNPVVPRSASRLLVVRDRAAHEHTKFASLTAQLRPGDLLVFNNSRVIPARLQAKKRDTGARAEVLLLEPRSPSSWLALAKPARRLKDGAVLDFERADGGGVDGGLEATVLGADGATGGRVLDFGRPASDLLAALPAYGRVPLPPYITESTADDEQYQTVYSETLGSAAAPTAGLHFTPELLDGLAAGGIRQAFVTLHVGVGTFRPVETDDIASHEMHAEYAEIPEATVDAIAETKARGGRVIAVGTTATRALEGAASAAGRLGPFVGKTDIYIYPGFRFQVVDGLITNFHLPKSTLLMMVSALIGRRRLLDLYREAVEREYRFFSFGDAMLVCPEAVLDPDADKGAMFTAAAGE